jgi:FkbM family methyltransferase
MKYSQNDEEIYILNYFGDLIGTFLSIGENDGVTFSNVRALALRGWAGVMLEPSPKAYTKLKELYKGHKNIYCYPYALSCHNGKAMLQESGPLCSAADVGLVSTFHAHEVARFSRTVKYEPVEVKTFKWKTFSNRLKSTRLKDAKFDFISMDCEGDELNILPDMDLTDTRCICIEWNSKPELKAEYEKYLGGFQVIYTSAENLIYAR